MTCREKLAIERPEHINDACDGGCWACPSTYGYLPDPLSCKTDDQDCTECWDREIPEEPKAAISVFPDPSYENELSCNSDIENIMDSPHILDSGNRREFGTGAVRDMAEGKGRCDLMPLDVVADVAGDRVYSDLNKFLETGDELNLITALTAAAIFSDVETMFLEVAKHFEEGCKKYGENNWRKGIPVKFYIDSAIRHYLKYRRGDKDEPHDRAFCWNILCAIWTYRHLPEMRGTIGNEQNKNEQDQHSDD